MSGEVQVLTNVGGRRKGKTVFTEAELARMNRQTVIEDSEFSEAMNKADELKETFFRLRARAVLCLLRLTGKRRGELAMLPLDNFKVEGEFLLVTFILEKKRKGNVLQKLSTKQISLSDPLTRPIIEYLAYLKTFQVSWFLPRASSPFGSTVVIINEHVSGRQVFNMVRSLGENLWPHLFRETAAADVIKQDNSIMGAFKVQRRLDLEDTQTGFNYLKRFAYDLIQREKPL